MGSALWAGISGLNSSSKEMDVIANNIANVNTIGYKAGKTFFADVLSQSISGGSSGSMQVGRGVEVTDVATQFSSGSFETTGSATDVSIDGDGFFMVNDKDGGTYYTRAGAFHMDSDGYLIDTNGYKVQGKNFFGPNQNTIADISLQNVQSAPQVSTTFSIGANLNAETATGDTFNSTQTLYDSLGAKHTLDVTFQKTEANGYWGYQAKLDGNKATAQTYSGLKFDVDGNLSNIYSGTLSALAITSAAGGAAAVVDNEGQINASQAGITLTKVNADSWTVTGNAAYPNMSLGYGGVGNDDVLTVDLDGVGGTDISIDLTTGGAWLAGDKIAFGVTHNEVAPTDINITFPALANGGTIGSANTVAWDLAGPTALTINQYASTSVMKSLNSDGWSSGLLKSLSIDKDGIIGGFFTNGQTSNLGQIVLAKFDNPWGLKKMGSNLFGETITSGTAIRNVPGASGLGQVASNSLEMSNTDVATEFINMITAQKAYQASARVVTTQDTLMQELMNLKR